MELGGRMFGRSVLAKNLPRSLLRPTTRNITFKIQQKQIGKQINFIQIQRDIFLGAGYRTFATSVAEAIPNTSQSVEEPTIFELDNETINEQLEKLNVKLEEAVKVIETQTTNAEAAPPPPGFFSGILETLQQNLESLHAMLGTPWWLTIIITCFALRTLLLPLAIRNARITALVLLLYLLSKIFFFFLQFFSNIFFVILFNFSSRKFF